MKNKFIYAIIFGATVFFSACSSSSKKESKEANSLSEKTFYEIDLSKDFTDSNCDNMLLSDIVEDVEYVQLETTDTNLLECYPRVKYALTKDDIYALNTNYTKEELFRFDRNTGKFISSIGSMGVGPQDMLKPSSLYSENDFVYVSSNISNKVYVYHKDGQHIRTVPIGMGSGKLITVIQDKYIIRHPGHNYRVSENNHKEGNPNQFFAATLFDMKGNALITKCDTLVGEGLPSISLDWDPRRWYYKGQLNFYNEVDNTVYEVTEKGVTPRYKLNLGKNQWIVIGKLAKKHMEYIKFHSFKETSDYLYIYWNQNQKAYFARFDKNTHNLDVQEQEPFKGRLWQLFAYGPKNDIDGCGYYFGPSETFEDKTGSILFEINPNNIDRVREALEKAENIKFPEKRQQLLKMLDERKEDDNPILVIYKLKK